MIETAMSWMPAFAAGGVLGAVFFGGLWLTVRRLAGRRRPLLWMGGSFLLRSAVVATGFILVGGGQWQRIVACLAGFLAVRLAMTIWVRRPREAIRGRE